MNEPRTEAGRRLLARKHPSVSADGSGRLPAFMWREYDEDIAAILAIEEEAARTATPSSEEAEHRLLMPPHPGGVYLSSALCSCGEWQWDGDSLPLDYRLVLRDHTAHAATPSSEGGGLRWDALRDLAEAGVCPVCDNHFRADGHAFDCPLGVSRATPDNASRGPIDELRAASRAVLDWTEKERWAGPHDWLDSVLRSSGPSDPERSGSGSTSGADDASGSRSAASGVGDIRLSESTGSEEGAMSDPTPATEERSER
jgi:hypothetical protein